MSYAQTFVITAANSLSQGGRSEKQREILGHGGKTQEEKKMQQKSCFLVLSSLLRLAPCRPLLP